jgi:hypothetical protein
VRLAVFSSYQSTRLKRYDVPSGAEGAMRRREFVTLSVCMPVEQPTKFGLVINLKIAKAIGVELPASIQLLAD